MTARAARARKAPAKPSKAPAFAAATCPNCGAVPPVVVWQEWIPSTRPIEVKGSTITISQDYTDHAEGAKGDGLFCSSCCHDWPIPEGIEVDHG